ncbi:mycofactocin dehydrogenase MftG [Actinomycetospora termitidis]|uniref:Mycofactocin system GMC family oxidoreductase MftG n=1 Tax=Actinomycetospora termitidis TaxID=3053470 RepID=A0ABT7M4Z1_9PSEU|nr:mycofactocin system GMC family oxidoreductase MftG [Actinomycetospora sp. Odt1-22]MDL5155731.1 mycofactocin system GMC family oxidoreductase MftG [Actinomycetospora sp. Odt1-22]
MGPGPVWDTLIVGGGSAGCALAGRLSEDPGRRVLLLEAGPAYPDAGSYPTEVRDVGSLASASEGHALNWAFATELAAGRRASTTRGRLLGGSSAINGANHLRATPADVEGWYGWSWEDARDAYVRGEDDHDFDGPEHGHAGPVPVERPAGELLAGLTQRVVRGAAGLGVPVERDKNAGGPPGVGLVPANAVRGVRVNAAMAYVLPHLDRPNLTVRGDTPVARVLLDGTRAAGVVTCAGERIEAGEVVLSAGAVKSPQLLALSGVGPADELRAAGVAVVADRPGVGHGWSDHPSVFLGFGYDESLHPEAVSTQAVVHLDAGTLDPSLPPDPAGDLEVLLFARPFSPGGPRHLMCAVQRPDSRGSSVLVDDDPSTCPRISHHYLASALDRARMRAVVRFAGELLSSTGITIPAVAGMSDPELDAWVAGSLTTSSHLCGSAATGAPDDPSAVVDPQFRVYGVQGLRVVDTSVLPVVPRRGPAATALMLGEVAARLMSAAGVDAR